MTRTRLGLLSWDTPPGWAAVPGGARRRPFRRRGRRRTSGGRSPRTPHSNGMHDPLVVKDLVVVGTDRGELRAYRAGTGEPAWTYAHGKRIFHRPATRRRAGLLHHGERGRRRHRRRRQEGLGLRPRPARRPGARRAGEGVGVRGRPRPGRCTRWTRGRARRGGPRTSPPTPRRTRRGSPASGPGSRAPRPGRPPWRATARRCS